MCVCVYSFIIYSGTSYERTIWDRRIFIKRKEVDFLVSENNDDNDLIENLFRGG